jgi:hypothetical protein
MGGRNALAAARAPDHHVGPGRRRLVSLGMGASIVYTGLGRPVSWGATMQSAYLIFDLAKVLYITLRKISAL